MPENTGKPPRHEFVDVVYRNGAISRGIPPSQRKWDIGDPKFPPNWEWEIERWQKAE